MLEHGHVLHCTWRIWSSEAVFDFEVKITFALSPLIAIVMLFCCTKDRPWVQIGRHQTAHATTYYPNNVTVVTGSLTTFHRLPIQAPPPAAQNPTRGFVICRSRPRLNHAWFNFYISVIGRPPKTSELPSTRCQRLHEPSIWGDTNKRTSSVPPAKRCRSSLSKWYTYTYT